MGSAAACIASQGGHRRRAGIVGIVWCAGHTGGCDPNRKGCLD